MILILLVCSPMLLFPFILIWWIQDIVLIHKHANYLEQQRKEKESKALTKELERKEKEKMQALLQAIRDQDKYVIWSLDVGPNRKRVTSVNTMEKAIAVFKYRHVRRGFVTLNGVSVFRCF